MKAYRHYRLSDWLRHIETCHWRTMELSLDRVTRVWDNLGRPMAAFDGVVITVAGTNGKGSCVAMLAAALAAAGVTCGSYTSPHLVRYHERVRIGGRCADDAELCRAFAAIEAARAAIPLTYFEFGTLCALLVFRARRVRVALLEVGMGGRLDAVNMVPNDLALITSIGLDHTRWLGTGRAAIAAEKAGVLKPGALAVCAAPRPPAVIARIAKERGCTLLQSRRDYRISGRAGAALTWHSAHAAVAPPWRTLTGLRAPLGGGGQRDNLGGVVAALALTARRTGITPAGLHRGLALTRLTARCQVLPGTPEVILDVAHNRDSAVALATFLRRRKIGGRTHAVLGVLADKPSEQMVATMAAGVDRWYLATLVDSAAGRGQRAAALKERLGAAAAFARCYPSPLAAYRAALAAAGRADRIVVFGSFHTVGAILAHIESPPGSA